jgi:hypothetical protein
MPQQPAPPDALQAGCAQLRVWALRQLRHLGRGLDVEAAHVCLLQHVAEAGVGRFGGLAWFRSHDSAALSSAGAGADCDAAGRGAAAVAGAAAELRLAARAAFHLAPWPRQAWAGIARALSHGLPKLEGGAGSMSHRSGGSAVDSAVAPLQSPSPDPTPRRGTGGSSTRFERRGSQRRSRGNDGDEAACDRWQPAAAPAQVRALSTKQAKVRLRTPHVSNRSRHRQCSCCCSECMPAVCHST